MRDRFGATNPRALQLRFHTQTAGSTLTAQQPDNNIVRVAIQALAAVLGGTQSLHTNGRDEALALPTEDAARIALRTQQIIATESGVANTVDPFARLVLHRAAHQRDRSRRRGRCSIASTRWAGRSPRSRRGYIQRQIQDSAYRAQIAVDAGEAVVVGVNRYATDETGTIEVFNLDPALEQAQIARVRAVRARRDESALEGGARRGRGRGRRAPRTWSRASSPPSKPRATVGEIADTLRAGVRRVSRSGARLNGCDGARR